MSLYGLVGDSRTPTRAAPQTMSVNLGSAKVISLVVGDGGFDGTAVWMACVGSHIDGAGVLHAAAERARLPDVSPHTLRHSFATHMLDGVADIRVVQELLVHASVATTQVYTLITVDRLREVYASSYPRALG